MLVVGGILIVVFSSMLVVANIHIYQKKRGLANQIKTLEQKIKDTKDRNVELNEGILRVDDQAYIEKVAREELDLQKPGETVISFVKKEGEPEQEIIVSKNIFQNLGGWVAGWFKD